MLSSMTGYGRSVWRDESVVVSVEVRSVNHRFAEVIVRMPREWMSLEEKAREMVLSHFYRGRIELFVTVTSTENRVQRVVEVDRELLFKALRVLKEVSIMSQLDFEPPSLGQLLAIPGLFIAVEAPFAPSTLDDRILLTISQGLQDLAEMRRKEGSRLQTFLTDRLSDLENECKRLVDLGSKSVESFRERLTRRMKEMRTASLVDAERIALEIAIVAERTSVEEELARLVSHVEQFRDLIGSPAGPVGRKLDFLLQEMTREVNTVGSKCSDVRMTTAVLESKYIIEQLREQVQNLE